MAKVIALDATVIIYAWEENPTYVRLAHAVLRGIEVGRYHALFSIIGMIELLTGPKRVGDFELAEKYKEMLSAYPNLSILPLTEAVVDIASSLRAKYRLTTPDAVHIATAMNAGADSFVTNDRALLKVREIKVELLHSYAGKSK